MGTRCISHPSAKSEWCLLVSGKFKLTNLKFGEVSDWFTYFPFWNKLVFSLANTKIAFCHLSYMKWGNEWRTFLANEQNPANRFWGMISLERPRNSLLQFSFLAVSHAVTLTWHFHKRYLWTKWVECKRHLKSAKKVFGQWNSNQSLKCLYGTILIP